MTTDPSCPDELGDRINERLSRYEDDLRAVEEIVERHRKAIVDELAAHQYRSGNWGPKIAEHAADYIDGDNEIGWQIRIEGEREALEYGVCMDWGK